MAKFIYKQMRVELDSGETWDVTPDQRDVAKWEVQPFGTPIAYAESRAFTFARFVAWAASVRQKLTALTWDEFDAQAASVDEGEPAPDDAEDPGIRAASDTH